MAFLLVMSGAPHFRSGAHLSEEHLMNAEKIKQTKILQPAPCTLPPHYLVLGSPAQQPALSGW